MNSLSLFRSSLEQQKGAREHVISLHNNAVKASTALTVKAHKIEMARTVIQEVAKQTQAELEYHISDTVTNALAAVFDDPYTFRLEFVLRRDKTEADEYWEKDGHEYQPNGGGVRDISAYAMQQAMLSLQNKGENILILDESWKHTKPVEAQRRAISLVREVSKEMDMQIIMVTSAETDKYKDMFTDEDKVFTVKKVNNISQVTSKGE